MRAAGKTLAFRYLSSCIAAPPSNKTQNLTLDGHLGVLFLCALGVGRRVKRRRVGRRRVLREAAREEEEEEEEQKEGEAPGH